MLQNQREVLLLVLEDVWDFLDRTPRRAFKSVARESDRVRTSKLLGALSRFADVDPAGTVINDIRNEADVELDPPSELVEDAGEPPVEVDLSPCVRETLQFFRMHNIRDISAARLAMRLLQLGRGSTVMTLEKNERLEEYINELKALGNSEKPDH